MNIAIIGSANGDEGKGRVVHDFSPHYDWVIRYSGGANAGHTIYRDGIKYVHNLIPSFDWRSSRPKAFLGSGMVIDLPQLQLEVSKLKEIDQLLPRKIFVDPDAFLVLPLHKEDDKKNNAHIGATNRGIGPAYKSKINRTGIRIRDVLEGNDSGCFYSQKALDELLKMGVGFFDSISLYSNFKNSSLLFEGAQGMMIDINHGTYPFVSCGDAGLAGIHASGFSSIKIDKVYGVVKCYSTKVGEGPFPTEIFGDEAEKLRVAGKEFGATTGRPRRIGWLDLPALKYACIKGGVTDLIITKFDILNGYGAVPVCTAYEAEPTCPYHFNKVETTLQNIPGWSDAKNIEELKPFIEEVVFNTNIKVSYISCGTSPEDLVQI
jgi:adenylosuccinate synthase